MNVGAAETTLTINGVYFVQGTAARIDGNILATSYVSSTSLTAVIPAGVIALAGAHVVSISNPAPGGGSSNSAQFVVGSMSTEDGDVPDGIGLIGPETSITLVSSPGDATPGPSSLSSLTPKAAVLADSQCTYNSPDALGQPCLGHVPWIPQVPPGDVPRGLGYLVGL